MAFEVSQKQYKAKPNLNFEFALWTNPDSKVHVANMGPTWVLSAPDGPHVGPMNFAIREVIYSLTYTTVLFLDTDSHHMIKVPTNEIKL